MNDILEPFPELTPRDLRDLAEWLEALATNKALGHKIVAATVSINGLSVGVSVGAEGGPVVRVLPRPPR